jgi:hypothetical protein
LTSSRPPLFRPRKGRTLRGHLKGIARLSA